MANVGYGGGYTATSYGAQGGADGGGFMAGGSQAGSQDTPSGNRTYGKDTMRPVTIKQIIDAVIPHPTAEPKIDGVDVTQLSLIGQILKVSSQATNTTFQLDDGTGTVDVKQWVDGDAEPSDTAKSIPKEGQYVHVWGRLKDFNGKRHIACHNIRIVTDYNEISYHLLEATSVHLYFTRGPPESLTGAGGAEVKSEGMFVDSYGANGAAAPASGGAKLPNSTSAAARRVYKLLQESPQNNEGLHVHNIAAQLKMPPNDVFKAGDELLQGGQIYTTIDDETWAVLEY